jgi:hypothetical protein
MNTDLRFEDVHGDWHCGSDYKQIKVTKVTGPGDCTLFIYVCNMQLDFDGGYNAYGPHGTAHLDSIDNAGPSAKHGWYGVKALTPEDAGKAGVQVDVHAKKDVKGRYPVIQGPGQPYPGLYVSQSSMAANPNLPEWDQRRYIDAATVPFGALGGLLAHKGIILGDQCLSLRLDKGLSCAYSFDDTAPSGGNLAECSYATFSALGGVRRGKHYQNNFLLCHMAFVNSANTSINTIFNKLSSATNAADLPLFIAYQMKAGPAHSGLELLKKHRHSSPEQRLHLHPPPMLHAAIMGLQMCGYMNAGQLNPAQLSFA